MVAGWLPQLLSLRYDVMPLQGPLMTTIAMKARLKRVAEKYPESTRVRLRRAFSRLGQAERESKDADAAFLFLWIAFNTAYARKFGSVLTPAILDLMLANPELELGDVLYPIV